MAACTQLFAIRRFACRILAPLVLLAGSAGLAQETNEETLAYFRRDRGLSSEPSPLPAKFDDSELLWRTPLPPGNSTPCLAGGKLYVTTWNAEAKELATVSVDARTGRILWTQAAPMRSLEAFHPTGSPASSSPACDGRQVYAFFGSYGMLCYDLDGKLMWAKELGPFQDEFGAASSPILVDGKVILNEDHDVNSFLMAIDPRDGTTIWRTERAEFARSYSTPVVVRANGKAQVVVAGSLQLAAYDPADGRKVWWVNGLSRIVDTTPLVTADRLYLATWTPGGDPDARITMPLFSETLQMHDRNGDNLVGEEELPEGEVRQRFFRMDTNQDKQLDELEWRRYAEIFSRAENVAMAIELGGEGDVTDTHVKWIHQRGLPTVSSPALYDGVLYMAKDSGILTTLDAATGQMIKQGRLAGRGNYFSSLVAGDGKVYATSESGVMTIVRAGGSWEVLGSHDFGERIMATPVLQDQRMYLRTDAALYCFGVAR